MWATTTTNVCRVRATPRFAFLEQHSTRKFSFRLTTSLHHLFIRLGKHCKRPVYLLPTAVASDILAFQISQCRGQIRVAESLLDSPRVHTVAMMQRGVGLAKFVKLELAMQARALRQRLQRTKHMAVGVSVLRWEDEIALR